MRIFLAIAAAALLVPAAVAGAAVESVVVVDYDLAAGEQPEGVAVDKRGDVYVSLAPLGQVWRIDRDGTERMLAQVVPAAAGNGVLGMAVDAPGNVYVAAATFDPASGVYKIARDGSFARLRGTEAIVFPNGVTLDKEGNVYVTDTILGAVWRVPAGGGPAELWFQSALLEGSGIFEFGVPLGANGIAYRQNAVVVGNTEGVGSFASRSSPMAAPVPSVSWRKVCPPGRGWDRVRRPRKRLGCGHRAEHHRSGVAHRRSDDHGNRCRRSRLGLEHRLRQERRPVGSQLRDRPTRRCGAGSPAARRRDERTAGPVVELLALPAVMSGVPSLPFARAGRRSSCQNMPAAPGYCDETITALANVVVR